MDEQLPPGLVEFVRRNFGEHAEEFLAQLRAAGLDMRQLEEIADLSADQIQAAVDRMRIMMAAAPNTALNGDMARDMARQRALVGGDPAISAQQAQEVGTALSIAEVWLDAVVDMPPAPGPVHAWSSSQWVEATMDTWIKLVEPLAEQVSQALMAVMDSQEQGSSDELLSMVAGTQDAAKAIRQMGAAMFALQLGDAAGTAARAVFGGTDLGLPLVPERALVPRGIAEFAAGLDVPAAEVRLYVAVREATRARLFAHAPWLRSYFLTALAEYARGITIDMPTLREALGSFNPTDPDSLAAALRGGMFTPGANAAQQVALAKLENVLTLVEGWVDEVATAAASPHLPHTERLNEMMRRRRAAGGPAEHAFASLVGLELRPKRARQAQEMFAARAQAGGRSERDSMWDHPDLLPANELTSSPGGEDLAAADFNPAELDAALERILTEDDQQPGST